MTRIGPYGGNNGDQPEISRDVTQSGEMRRRSRRGDEGFDLRQRSRDGSSRERQFQDSPHEQETRAKAFQNRVAETLKSARGGARGEYAKPDKSPTSLSDLFARRPAARGGSDDASEAGTFRVVAFDEDANDKREASDAHDEGEIRLLAIAEPPVNTLSLLFAPQTSEPADQASGTSPSKGGRISNRVDMIEARVDAAMRTELAAGISAGFKVDLPLDSSGEGLLGLSLTMGPDGLDIVLLRTDGLASDELVKAAASLAERLQKRYAKRTVRVMERIVPRGSGIDAGETMSDPQGRI